MPPYYEPPDGNYGNYNQWDPNGEYLQNIPPNYMGPPVQSGNPQLDAWRQQLSTYRPPQQEDLNSAFRESGMSPSSTNYSKAILDDMLSRTQASRYLSPFALAMMRNQADSGQSSMRAALTAGARGETVPVYGSGEEVGGLARWMSDYYGGNKVRDKDLTAGLMQQLDRGSTDTAAGRNTSQSNLWAEYNAGYNMGLLARALSGPSGGSFGNYQRGQLEAAMNAYNAMAAREGEGAPAWVDYLKQQGLWQYPTGVTNENLIPPDRNPGDGWTPPPYDTNYRR